MSRDDKQPDIYSFRTGQTNRSESRALDEALTDAVDGIAESLREEEQFLQQQTRRKQRRYALFVAIWLVAIVLPATLLYYRKQFDGNPNYQKAPSSTRASKFQGITGLESGVFLMRLPKGFEWIVRLTELSDHRYRLTSKHNLNSLGVYELQGNLLVMVEPADKRLTEFQWQLKDGDSLELVAEPPASKTGGNYLGTTLTRNPESE